MHKWTHFSVVEWVIEWVGPHISYGCVNFSRKTQGVELSCSLSVANPYGLRLLCMENIENYPSPRYLSSYWRHGVLLSVPILSFLTGAVTSLIRSMMTKCCKPDEQGGLARVKSQVFYSCCRQDASQYFSEIHYFWVYSTRSYFTNHRQNVCMHALRQCDAYVRQ